MSGRSSFTRSRKHSQTAGELDTDTASLLADQQPYEVPQAHFTNKTGPTTPSPRSAPGILITQPTITTLDLGEGPERETRSDCGSESDASEISIGNGTRLTVEKARRWSQAVDAEEKNAKEASGSVSSTVPSSKAASKRSISSNSSRKYSCLLQEIKLAEPAVLLRSLAAPEVSPKGIQKDEESKMDEAELIEIILEQPGASVSINPNRQEELRTIRGSIDSAQSRQRPTTTSHSQHQPTSSSVDYLAQTWWQRLGSNCCGRPKDSRRRRWKQSKTFSSALHSLMLSLAFFIPGLALHFSYPDLKLANVGIFTWATALSVLIMLFTAIRSLLHVLLYHVVPERFYEHIIIGNVLYYASEMINYIATTLWILCNLIFWNLVWPFFTYPKIMTQYPLNQVQPLILVGILWTVTLGLKHLIFTAWDDRFHNKAFLERIREVLFIDFIVETMREAKRRRKFWAKVEGTATTTTSTHQNPLLKPQSKELRRRARYVYPLQSLLHQDDQVLPSSANPQEVIPAHSWKKLLDHFYRIMLLDEQVLEGLEEEAENYDEELLRAVEDSKRLLAKIKKERKDKTQNSEKALPLPGQEYHHLHHFHFDRRKRRLNQRRDQVYTLDERSGKLATKLFKSLKQPDQLYLDLEEDIMPLFQASDHFTETSVGTPLDSLNRPATAITQTSTSSLPSASSTWCDSEWLKRQEAVSKCVRHFFLARTDNGRISERELRFSISRAAREQARLVSSLAGMRTAIQRVSDFCNFLLSLFLGLGTLSIFGVDAFGTLLSIGSALVSFAFFFGSSARGIFESVVFLFFIHPFDVGDRIVVEGQSYLVSKINLLSTVLERWDGQLIYMPNTKLITVDIYNYRRSNPQWETIIINVSFKTPRSQIDALCDKLNDFVESDRVDFTKKVTVSIDQFVNLETMTLKVNYCHCTNWQNYELYQARKAKFFRALNLAIKEVGISWAPLPKPVHLLPSDHSQATPG